MQSAHEENMPVPAENPVARQLELAKASLAETEEATRQAEAELDNIRRRVQEDVSRANKYAIEGFAESVLPVKDSLETALTVPTPTTASIQEGVGLTLKQLDAAFARNKVEEIDPQPGERLDPAQHRAIPVVPARQDADTIVSVLQRGYRIGDRVLRPALVTVGERRGEG